MTSTATVGLILRHRAAAPQQRSTPIPPRRLFAFLAMCFGMFMAFLDIQIVSSSLADIQAGLSASADEIPWVQTAYLIAEVIAIPLSGFLSRALGTRILFAASAAGFTLASVMCGTSSSIDSMIVWRALQGFIGGGMVPTVFASAYLIFQGPRQKFVAPVVGPDRDAGADHRADRRRLSDRHLFVALAVFHQCRARHRRDRDDLSLVDFDKPDFALLKNFDWYGLLSMAGFLGALEYVLEEGPRYEWFDDDTIFMVAIVSGGFGDDLLRPRADRAGADRRPARLRQPQFCGRQPVLLRARHRTLRPDLSFSGLSRPGARLRCADDRRDHVRLRPGDVFDRADRRPARRAVRPALRSDRRLRVLRHRHLADDLSSRRTGISGNCCGRRSSAASA